MACGRQAARWWVRVVVRCGRRAAYWREADRKVVEVRRSGEKRAASWREDSPELRLSPCREPFLLILGRLGFDNPGRPFGIMTGR